MPREQQIEFSKVAQHEMDRVGKELTATDLLRLFEREYGAVYTAKLVKPHAKIDQYAEQKPQLEAAH
jgi:isopropylmalate/homocitrate/citramalate synthase